jgi:hypothetical protein
VRVIRFGNGLAKTYWTHFGLLATSSRLELGENSVKLPDIDRDGVPKPGDYPSFGTPDNPSDLCIRYGSVERWVLVNDTDECHNFHIHQTRFRVREIALVDGEKANACSGPQSFKDFKTLHDNFPLPPVRASSWTWRSRGRNNRQIRLSLPHPRTGQRDDGNGRGRAVIPEQIPSVNAGLPVMTALASPAVGLRPGNGSRAMFRPLAMCCIRRDL